MNSEKDQKPYKKSGGYYRKNNHHNCNSRHRHKRNNNHNRRHGGSRGRPQQGGGDIGYVDDNNSSNNRQLEQIYQNHQHEPIFETTRNNDNEMILWWYSPKNYVPLQAEEAMISVIMRWGQTERGMMKDQPPFRLPTIKKRCQETGILLEQALSLRRHHINLYHPYKSMAELRLGHDEDIRQAAKIFEECVEEFLKTNNVPYITEHDQKEKYKKEQIKMVATPDFLLPQEILLKTYYQAKTNDNPNDNRNDNPTRVVLQEQKINWIEVKMYYGASTIPHGTKNAVGSVMGTAKKYVSHFGTGAILFMYGCGERLAAELKNEGVISLDCSGTTIKLDKVHEHQRTWCANEAGEILP